MDTDGVGQWSIDPLDLLRRIGAAQRAAIEAEPIDVEAFLARLRVRMATESPPADERCRRDATDVDAGWVGECTGPAAPVTARWAGSSFQERWVGPLSTAPAAG